jgi:hypothetical protein
MRILPHTLFMADSDVFGPVAKNILLDGIATHGHPRALVGALCYGYALWKSLRRTDRLQFGEVIDDLLDNSIPGIGAPSRSPTQLLLSGCMQLTNRCPTIKTSGVPLSLN